MKKLILATIALCGLLSVSSCCNDSRCHDDKDKKCEVREGLVSTHTRRAHHVHQYLSPEERAAAKDHITRETLPGASHERIDADGAKMVNDSRGIKPCDKREKCDKCRKHDRKKDKRCRDSKQECKDAKRDKHDKH